MVSTESAVGRQPMDRPAAVHGTQFVCRIRHLDDWEATYQHDSIDRSLAEQYDVWH